jgi:hypothetical protein
MRREEKRREEKRKQHIVIRFVLFCFVLFYFIWSPIRLLSFYLSARLLNCLSIVLYLYILDQFSPLIADYFYLFFCSCFCCILKFKYYFYDHLYLFLEITEKRMK